MVLVSSSCSIIYQSYALRRLVHNKRRKTAFYYGKVCKRLRKRADDDRTDWTMKTTTRGLTYFSQYIEAMR